MRCFALILAVGLSCASAAHAASDVSVANRYIGADCSAAGNRPYSVAMMDDHSVEDLGTPAGYPSVTGLIRSETSNDRQTGSSKFTLATYLVGSVTKASSGESIYGVKSRQTNGPGAGQAVEFQTKIVGRNYGGILFSNTQTDATLWVPVAGRFSWPLRRYEFDILWTHEFPAVRHRMVPYVTGGAGAIALNGGVYSGWDRQAALVGGGGSDIRVARRITLRAGFTMDSLKASTYGDPTYRSTGTLMVEPRIGLVWGFEKRSAR